MKKSLFVMIALMLLCSGCTSSEDKIYDEITESGYGVGWGGNPEGLKCEEIKDAISISDNEFFLTSDGKVYRFNESQLFSNDKNCIEIEYEEDNIAYRFFSNFYDQEDNLIYIYDRNTSSLLTREEYENKNNYLRDELKDIDVDYDFISYNDCANNELLYVKDNKVYYYSEDSEDMLLGEIPSEEDILYMDGAVIKTNKNYYELTRTNEEECNKYVDVECEYGFTKSSLSDIYDKIIFASQEYVIDDKYRMYGKGSCFSIGS